MLRRTLRSAVVASILLAANLVVLTLFLNPALSPREEAPALLLSLLLPYVVLGTATLLLLVGLHAAFRFWPLPASLVPGWPWLGTFLSVVVAATAAAYAFNLLSYRHSIPLDALHALAASTLVIGFALLVLVAVDLDALIFPRRPRSVSAVLTVLAPAVTLVIPLALRPAVTPAPPPVPVAIEPVAPGRRVTLIGIDGLSPDFVRAGMASGNLAALARLARRGAMGPLATLRPTEAPPIWTTILTGCFPRDHGIKSFATYRLLGSSRTYELLPKGALVGLLERARFVSTRPVTSNSRRRRALWNVLSAFGIPAGVVRLWGTYPPEQVQGFTLSNYFHLFLDDKSRAEGTLYPPDLLPVARARRGAQRRSGRRAARRARGRAHGSFPPTRPGAASSWTARSRRTSPTAAPAWCCARPTTRRSSRRTSTASTWWGTPSTATRTPRASATCRPRSRGASGG